jgi:hypothetical protein
MKKYLYILPVAAFLAATGSSCQQNTSTEKADINDTVEAPSARTPIVLAPVTGSPEFQDAQLALGTVKAVASGKDSAKVSFTFSVKNYELKGQTADAAAKNCNNSDKGQHIHFIMDNAPYTALYEPKHELTLANNTEHYLMCFLSRSYHESLKNKGAALVYHFRIDEKGKLQVLEAPKTPMLFYSRPKGDYLGKDTANLLLDYYVWNAEPGTYQVKAAISNSNNGQAKEEMLDSWKALFIQNLGTGKSSVTLTITDKDGKAMEGPMTTVTRNIQLAAQEPLQ